MSLFYYTTIQTLALILNSKCIRFRRLDFMDDLKEAEEFSVFNPLQYIFTFCLTRDKTENIPMWKMYSNLETGIRIEFDKDTIFNPKPKGTLIPMSQEKIDFPQYVCTALCPLDIINSDYICLFLPPQNSDAICQIISYKEIIYNDNFKDLYKKQLCYEDLKQRNRKVWLNPHDFGFYKTKYWKFQKESRFLIHTIPFADTAEKIQELLFKNKKLQTEYIDVPLSDGCLNNLVIRLSPKADYASRLIVESLTKGFDNIQIEDSDLKGHLR